MRRSMRKSWLPVNHSNAIPRQIIAFDTETQREAEHDGSSAYQHTLRLGCAMSARIEKDKLTRRKELTFKHPVTLWDWIEKQTGPRQTTWVFAHSLVFDLIISGFWEELHNGRFQFDKPRRERHPSDNHRDNPMGGGFCILDDAPSIISVKSLETDGRLVLLDTRNWFNCPLHRLGDWLGIPKLTMPGWSESDEAWSKYCMRDTEIVLETMFRFITWSRNADLGMFRYTAASQAMAAFCHNRCEHWIITDHAEEIKQLSRNAYYGGQRAVLRHGKYEGRFFKLDVTSLFPSVMRGNLFPIKPLQHLSTGDWDPFEPDVDLSMSVAKVRIDSKVDAYPVRRPDGIYYAAGRFETTLAGPELSIAHERGHVKGWGSWATFKSGEIFTRYVDDMWALRQKARHEGNPFVEQFSKLLLNSLYGKFGQLSADWVWRPNVKFMDPWTTCTVLNIKDCSRSTYRAIGYEVQELVGRSEYYKSFPAIAAFVTSYARLAMYGHWRMAGAANVYYQGIDSLIVNERGYNRLADAGLVRPFEMGTFKLEGEAGTIDIRSTGSYSFGKKQVHCGLPVRSVVDGRGNWDMTTFSVLPQMFNGSTPNKIVERTRRKTLSARFDRGEVLDDGRVAPLSLADF